VPGKFCFYRVYICIGDDVFHEQILPMPPDSSEGNMALMMVGSLIGHFCLLWLGRGAGWKGQEKRATRAAGMGYV
jgi:hypothetical protein